MTGGQGGGERDVQYGTCAVAPHLLGGGVWGMLLPQNILKKGCHTVASGGIYKARTKNYNFEIFIFFRFFSFI